MANAHLIIIADRGMLKTYEVRQTKHGPSPRMIVEMNLKSARELYRDKVTDQAGSFPSTGSGGHANAIAEKSSMEAEEDARLFKSLGHQIEELIRQHQPDQLVICRAGRNQSSHSGTGPGRSAKNHGRERETRSDENSSCGATRAFSELALGSFRRRVRRVPPLRARVQEITQDIGFSFQVTNLFD